MPDNRHVVFASDFAGPVAGSHLWMADVQSGAIEALTSMTARERDPAASPDGLRIAFTSDASNFDVLEIPTNGSPPVVRLGSSRDESDPVWTGSGGRFAYVTDRSGEPEIWLEDPSAQIRNTPIVRSGQFPDGRTFLISRLAFSADRGGRLIYQRQNRDTFDLWVSTLGGGPPGRLPARPGVDYQDSPTWSPDGQSVAFTFLSDRGWALGLAQPGGSDVPTTLLDGLAAPCDPHWSPANAGITCQQEDGLYLVSLDGQSRTRLTNEVWLAHDWAGPNRLLGLRETDELRWQLVAVDLPSSRISVVNPDIGPAPPVGTGTRGFSVSPDGTHVLTSVLRLRGDIYLLQGFRQPRPPSRWFGWLRP
jgi:Tol biopolymer transport system component